MLHITILLEYDDTAEQPAFSAGMQLLGGNIVGVQFSDLMAEHEKLVDAVSSDSPLRLANSGDIDAAAEYEKRIARACGVIGA